MDAVKLNGTNIKTPDDVDRCLGADGGGPSTRQSRSAATTSYCCFHPLS